MKREEADPRIARLNITSETKLQRYSFAGQAPAGDRVEPIGLGGSSVVYKVHQQLDEARGVSIPRALKLFVMREDLVPSSEETSFMPAQANFLEEISNVSQLTHENLVQITDAGEINLNVGGRVEKIPYLVSHLITGCTLRDVIDGRPSGEFAREAIRVHPELAVKLLSQVAAGLGYLHARGFLHCDVAPKNIFIENVDGLRAVLGDVGMSRQVEGASEDSVFIAGTRSYAPGDIVEYFGQEVPRRLLKSWFPVWDAYGYAKACMEFLSYVSGTSPRPWLRAAVNKAKNSLEKYAALNRIEHIIEQIEYCLPVHRERGGVPELEPNTLLSRKRMMPIEALSFTKRIDSLVRHPALMRLQCVPQLTIVRSASPGGNHTRYEHALGVMENVRRMLSTLLDESSFLGVLSKHSIETGLLAALLYNGTRFPFSNIIHELNKRLPPGGQKIFASFDRGGLFAELFGSRFKSQAGLTLEEKIASDFPSVDVVKLRRILTSNSASALQEPDEAVLYALLNSSLDARVIDFVRRDSLHLGLSSGDFFDLDDLLPHLIISPAGVGSGSQVSLKTSGVSVAEQIILMRYWLYQRVYWNQPNRSFNAIIRRALLDLRQVDGFERELRDCALVVDEREMLRFLREFSVRHKLESVKMLLDFVVGHEKVLYWEAFDRNLRQCDSDPLRQDKADLEVLISPNMSYHMLHAYEQELSNWLARELDVKENLTAPLVLLDIPFEPGNVKLGADIVVAVPSSRRADESDLRTLEKVSPVIAGVNQNFVNDLQRLRIFVHPSIRLEKSMGWKLYERLRAHLHE